MFTDVHIGLMYVGHTYIHAIHTYVCVIYVRTYVHNYVDTG